MAKKKVTSTPKKTKAADKPKREQSPFAKFVVGYRMVNGLSQRDLATKLGVVPTVVALIELDRNDLPISFFKHLCKHLEANEVKRVQEMFYNKLDSLLEV